MRPPLVVRIGAGLLVAYTCAPLILGHEPAARLLGPLAPAYMRDQIPVLAAHELWDLGHRLGGATLLLLGLAQLYRFRSWHRAAGRVYVVVAAVPAVGGGWMAIESPFSAGETLPALSFAALLLVSTAIGARSAQRGAIAQHRRWMARSYAIALGPLLVRAVHMLLSTQMTEHEAMAPAFWAGWPLPLLALEVSRRRKARAQ